METTDKIANFTDETFDKISSASHQASEALCEKSKQLKNAEQQLMKDCRRYVNDNPVTSLGIAVAAGFLLSRLMSSR